MAAEGYARSPADLAAHRVKWPQVNQLGFEQRDNQQQDHCTNYRINDRADDAADIENANHRQQPTGNQAADDADDDVPDEPETITLHDQTGEPTGHPADDKPNNQINEHHSLRVIAAGSSPAACGLDAN